MGVDAKHPDYLKMEQRWKLQRDVAEGVEQMRDAQDLYLPKPSAYSTAGGQADGGLAAYLAYRTRADMPDILPGTVSAMVGLIHKTEFEITGLEEGKPLHDLLERATRDGLPLAALARRVTAELLLMGRY